MAPVRPDALTRALDDGRLSEAQYALERAHSLSRLPAVRREFGTVHRADPHSATLILRDLALRVPSLAGAEREQAQALFARPTENGTDPTLDYSTTDVRRIDSQHFRIHYVVTTSDAATLEYARDISRIMEEVYAKQVNVLGWDAPLSDRAAARNGGNGLFDVYLGDVGALRLFGYCQGDPGQFSYRWHSYCVLDNDFSAAQFGEGINGLLAAKVTAAHEFSHGIQLSYDVAEDAWLFEATAVWMEDAVYDGINDHYRYLDASSLSRPHIPADTWAPVSQTGPNSGFHYGQFVWMSYFSERFGKASVIRRIWEKARTPRPGPAGLYSVNAIAAMLSERGVGFASSFADFAVRNVHPAAFYEEGTEYAALLGPVRTETHSVSSAAAVRASATDVDHLSSRYISFAPTAVDPGEQLTIAVNMGSSPKQKANVITITGGTPTVRKITLIGGAGHVTVPFGDVDEVVLVLTNASKRMICGAGAYSCNGWPLDDNRSYTYSAVTGTTPADPGVPPAPVQDGPRVQDFNARPSTFSPDGDGNKDETRIGFTLLDDARVTMVVYRRSKLLGYFLQGQLLEGRRDYGFWWSGHGVSGGIVPDGVYTIRLVAVDASGGTLKKTEVRVRT